MSKRKPETLILYAAVILLMAMTGCVSAPEEAPEPDVRTTTPEAALDAFVTAWNSGDYRRVRATFLPERRALLDSRKDDVSARMQRWQIESAEVDSLCHPRGGGWKNTTFVRVDGVDKKSDAAWVRLHDGSWWMYSL